MTTQQSATSHFNGRNIDWFGKMEVREMIDFGVSTGSFQNERPRDLEIVLPILAADVCERVVDVGAGCGPDHQELLSYAGAAGLELAQNIEYATDRSAHRRLYVFRKPAVH